ncbi:hypothetical protein BDR26DRAFT_152395 [Obelidium mucronatum]|nr:hypothetical protein BDR26DRAFT_152395 [Obelidium mucronatum]
MQQHPPPNPQERQAEVQPPPGPVWDPPLTADRAIFNGFMRLAHLPTQGVLAACQAGGINPPPVNANVAVMRQHVLEFIRDNLEPFPMDLELDGYGFHLVDGRLTQAIRPPAPASEGDDDDNHREEDQPQVIHPESSDQSDGDEEVTQLKKRQKVVKKKKHSGKKSKRYQSSSESDDSECSSSSSDEEPHPKKKNKALKLDILQSEFNRQPDNEQV